MVSYLDGYAKDFCSHCKMHRTEEGHDGCIGTLPDVMNACCGHGEDRVAYVQLNHEDYNEDPNRFLLQGDEALDFIRSRRDPKVFLEISCEKEDFKLSLQSRRK